jgi:hypothetical protein
VTRARAFLIGVVAWLAIAIAGQAPRAAATILSEGVDPHPTSSPSITSVLGTPAGGGSTTITGTGFTAASQVGVCMHPCAWWQADRVATTSVTSTSIVATVGALAAGDYDVIVNNFSGGRDTAPSALHVISTTPPSVTFGTDLASQWICDNAVTDVNGVNKVPDSTANVNDLTQSTGSAEPQLSLASTKFNGHASCVHDGVNDYLEKTSFALGAGTDVYVYGAIYVTATNGSHAQVVARYGNGDLYVRVPTSQVYLEVGKAGTNADLTAASVVGQGGNFLSGFVGGSTESIQTNNLTAVSTAITGNASTAGLVDIGQRSGADFAGFEWAEIGILKRKPTPTEATSLIQYLNGQYLTHASPTITGVTNVGAGWASAFRVQGANLDPGLTAQVTIAGTPTTLTATQISSTYAEFAGFPSTSAGTANTFLLTNPDTRSITYDNLPIVARATDPMSSEGLVVAGWYGGTATKAGGGTPATSDKIQLLSDLSLSGNDELQATSANQPTWTVGDANFVGVNSWTGDGSTSKMSVAALRQTSLSEYWVMSVCRQASTTGTQVTAHGSGDVYESTSSGTPRGAKGGTFVNWTGTVSGVHMLMSRYNGSSTIGINVDNGTEQTAAASGALTNNAVFELLVRNSANFWNGSCSTVVLYTSPPDLTRARSFAQSMGAP